MTTPRISLTLACCLALAMTPGCKKGSTTTPDGDSPGGDAAADNNDAGSGGSDGGYDGPSEEVLTADSFEETMQGKQSDVADCFAEAKAAKPDLKGKLALDVTVGGGGSVTAVKFDESSTIKEASITSCVEGKAKSWKFPKTRDGSEMTLPYSLNLS